jgi:hypothetical protein
MDVSAHLPLMDFGGNRYTLRQPNDLQTSASLRCRRRANDHMVVSVPWLDDP